jgi:hypothetical protein
MQFITSLVIGQGVYSGNYNILKIDSGVHYISTPVFVQDRLEILPGAKIIISEPGVIICYGSVSVMGDINRKVEILGSLNNAGQGIVIKSLDSGYAKAIDIKNTIFQNLQVPILFDFGWKRKEVNITDNQFINNISKLTLIQISNPMFKFNGDSLHIYFRLSHNLFSGNQSSIYVEDFSSDFIDLDISHNTFINNKIYASLNYNVSSNMIYGRSDNLFSRYSSKIDNNSFVNNFLMDATSDTILQVANFGVYGSSKKIYLDKNYWGSTDNQMIAKSIYDQKNNASIPEVVIDPILNTPSIDNPTHIYSVMMEDTMDKQNDSLKSSSKSYILKSNNKANYTKANLHYTYYKDDTSEKSVDSVLSFNIINDENRVKLEVLNSFKSNTVGYYIFNNIVNDRNEYVPDVTIGYQQFLTQAYKRKLLRDSVSKNGIKIVENKNILNPDTIKNEIVIVEAKNTIVRRFELGVLGGGAMFLGTVSSSNSIFKNDINLMYGLNINYIIGGNFSTDVAFRSFDLSNSDINFYNGNQVARGMKFSTSMLTISPTLNYDFVNNKTYSKTSKIRPSIGIGVDLVHFNPTGQYNGKTYDLQPLGTGGQLVNNKNAAYSLNTINYLLSFKLKYLFNKYSSIALQMSYHLSGSNYLDDVGHDLYPSIADMLSSNIPNKEAAIYFSNPTPSINTNKLYRDHPTYKSDAYVLFGITFSRKIF